MTLNPQSILPSSDVLEQCRNGLTKRIREKQRMLRDSKFDDLKVFYSDELYRLRIIREEVQWLIDNV